MAELAELRERVAAANRALHDAGLVELAFGNVSGVDAGTGVLAIKPSGIACKAVQPEDVVVVALDDGRVVAGSLRPSTDTPTHRFLYRSFPEIGGIVHTHSPAATAWAQAGRSIPCFGTTHADFCRGPVPVTRPLRTDEINADYEWETGRVIVETLAAADRSPMDAPAVLVGSHGPFAWDRSPEAAVEAAVALELVASIAIQTLAIRADTPAVSDALMTRHYERKHGDRAYYGQPRKP